MNGHAIVPVEGEAERALESELVRLAGESWGHRLAEYARKRAEGRAVPLAYRDGLAQLVAAVREGRLEEMCALATRHASLVVRDETLSLALATALKPFAAMGWSPATLVAVRAEVAATIRRLFPSVPAHWAERLAYKHTIWTEQRMAVAVAPIVDGLEGLAMMSCAATPA